jgi:predicted RNase H-like HicB family nuclease
MTAKKNSTTSKAGYVVLTLTVSKEGKHYVSECEELGTASFGETVDEAVANVIDASTEYLRAIERLGERKRIFKERGIAIRRAPPRKVRQEYEISPGAFVGPYVTKVPA